MKPLLFNPGRSTAKKGSTLFKVVCVALWLTGIAGCAGQGSKQRLVWRDDSAQEIFSTPRSALFIPLAKIRSEYTDNTTLNPTGEFSDSFFMAVTNGLVMYEINQRFKVIKPFADTADTDLSIPPDALWSNLDKKAAAEKKPVQWIREIAEQSGADLVIVPGRCHLKHQTLQPAGWRNGPSYDRPVSYTAHSEFHLQIWSKEGTLLYEKLGRGSSGQPVLYNMLKRDAMGKDDVVTFSRRVFAPPLVKAIGESIRDSFKNL